MYAASYVRDMRQDNRLKGFGEDSARIGVDKSGSGRFLIVLHVKIVVVVDRGGYKYFSDSNHRKRFIVYTFYLRDYGGRRRQQEDLRYRIVNGSPPLPSRHRQTHLLVIT